MKGVASMNEVFWKLSEGDMFEFFLSLTDEEAQTFFQHYLGLRDSRLALLKRTFHETSEGKEVDLDFSPNSLVLLWRWAAKQLRRREYTDAELLHIKSLPDWFEQYHLANKPLSEDTLILLNDIAYYLGEVLIRNLPNVRWQVCKTGVERYCDENQPVLSGFMDPVDPRGSVKIAALKTLEGTSGDQALLDIYNRYVRFHGKQSPQ
jgi:hypothetical protein